MWLLFLLIAFFCLIFGFFKSITQRHYHAGSIQDVYAFKHDVQNPAVDSKQLDKNIRSGKYKKKK